MDIRKPLKRRMRVVVEDEDEPIWADFRYERLPALCYGCGIIGHNENDCIPTLTKKKQEKDFTFQYGSWLRAPPRQSFMKGNTTKGKEPEQQEGRQIGENRREIPSTEKKEGKSGVYLPEKMAENGELSKVNTIEEKGTMVIAANERRDFNFQLEGNMVESPKIDQSSAEAREMAARMDVDKCEIQAETDEKKKDKISPKIPCGTGLGTIMEEENGPALNVGLDDIILYDVVAKNMGLEDSITHELGRELSEDEARNKKTELGQRVWKRKARVKSSAKENTQNPAKAVLEGENQKRKAESCEEGNEEKEEGKKRKILSELSNQASVAGVQPRRSQ